MLVTFVGLYIVVAEYRTFINIGANNYIILKKVTNSFLAYHFKFLTAQVEIFLLPNFLSPIYFHILPCTSLKVLV